MARYKRSFDGERRTVKKTLQLTPSESAAQDAAAKAQGLRWSHFARELLCRRTATVVASTRRNPEAAALARELAGLGNEAGRLGNNLNQLAHRANATGAIRSEEAIEATLADIGQLRDRIRKAVEKVIEL